ncbi:MAG: hypothetical protein HY695_26820 [Deltaproteobacteria bacterium]|nr:hypothetical protein [Deltaproteobacteria bacterium]
MDKKKLPTYPPFGIFCFAWVLISPTLFAGCAPKIIEIAPQQGPPGTFVRVSMEYLVGWPRVELGGKMIDFYQLKLQAADSNRKDVPGEELVWIENKILRFIVPELPPGEYKVTIHDDKGPPNDEIYSILETTAYLIFPPVWPFVFRSNAAVTTFTVLPKN